MMSAEPIEIPAQLGELTVGDGPGYDGVHGADGELAERGLLVRCERRGLRLPRLRRSLWPQCGEIDLGNGAAGRSTPAVGSIRSLRLAAMM